jgi:hypothetical protein
MSKSAKCWSCKATYHFDKKDWDSFICEICKTFISNKRQEVYINTMNHIDYRSKLSSKKNLIKRFTK